MNTDKSDYGKESPKDSDNNVSSSMSDQTPEPNLEMVDEWHKAFPMLTRLKDNCASLMMRVDCFMVGLNFFSACEHNDPFECHLVIFPLYRDFFKIEGMPIALKSLNETIEYKFLFYNNHNLKTAIKLAKKKFGRFLQPEVKLSDILDIAHTRYHPCRSFFTTQKLTLQLAIATYIENTQYREYILKKIREDVGVTDNRRIGREYTSVANRDKMVAMIEKNAAIITEINKMNVGHIVMDFDPSKPSLRRWLDELLFD